MTPKMINILSQMAKYEDRDEGELVSEGIYAYLGNRRVSLQTVYALLRLCAIRDASISESVHRYAINSTGKALLERPELVKAIHAGKSFSIIEGKIVFL